MRKLLGAAAVLAIALPAYAQTTTTTPMTPPGPPAATVPGPMGQPQTGTAPTVPNATAPITTPNTAQNSVTTPTPTAPGSVLAPGSAAMPADTLPKTEPGAPVAGANSFTESQAKARIESRGYTNVTGLKKDDQSIWRGTASKDGKQVTVALDYQGNVVGD